MTKTSEYCAVGHPDRMCDYIVSFILDRFLENDPMARVALECQLKDNHATLSGEVTSTASFSDEDLKRFVRAAIHDIGYTKKYQSLFGAEHTIAADDVEVTLHISRQSPDIAQGVNEDGWGDQGIFFGYAVRDPKHGNMPYDYYLAREIANYLATSGFGGLDIKTQVTTQDDKVIEVAVAIPTLPNETVDCAYLARQFVEKMVGSNCRITINGTGRYVTHGPIGDCGTTGRKLVVDFYGGNSRIGGGSPWGKDPTKADVALNMEARRRALRLLKELPSHSEITCQLSSVIGQKRIRATYFGADNRLIFEEEILTPPSQIIERLGLRKPEYAERCRKGLFGFEG